MARQLGIINKRFSPPFLRALWHAELARRLLKLAALPYVGGRYGCSCQRYCCLHETLTTARPVGRPARRRRTDNLTWHRPAAALGSRRPPCATFSAALLFSLFYKCRQWWKVHGGQLREWSRPLTTANDHSNLFAAGAELSAYFCRPDFVNLL